MNRTWLTWTIFTLCLLVGLAGMSWISYRAVQLDRRDAEAQRRSDLEENVRLALWRLDSSLLLLISQENARPASEYRAFYSSTSLYDGAYRMIQPGQVLVRSPLQSPASPFTNLHFQIDLDASTPRFTSPQIPPANAVGVSWAAEPQRVTVARRRLDALRSMLIPDQLRRIATRLEPVEPQPGDLTLLYETGGDLHASDFSGGTSNSRALAADGGVTSANLADAGVPAGGGAAGDASPDKDQAFTNDLLANADTPNQPAAAAPPPQPMASQSAQSDTASQAMLKQVGRARNTYQQQELRNDAEFQQRKKISQQAAYLDKLVRDNRAPAKKIEYAARRQQSGQSGPAPPAPGAAPGTAPTPGASNGVRAVAVAEDALDATKNAIAKSDKKGGAPAPMASKSGSRDVTSKPAESADRANSATKLGAAVQKPAGVVSGRVASAGAVRGSRDEAAPAVRVLHAGENAAGDAIVVGSVLTLDDAAQDVRLGFGSLVELTDGVEVDEPDIAVGEMLPAWINGELLLLRRVRIDGRDTLQGVWLDWSALRPWLLDQVTDLLPAADLRAAPDDAALDATIDPRPLAAAPLVLVHGASTTLAKLEPLSTQTRTTLIVTWLCVFIATVAVVALLRGVIALSERRGDFVSAVTHELRTPLTTFRMYTGMLCDGMVTDEAKRDRYLGTLRVESDRLGHLVENVLAYARLDRGRGTRQRTEPITLGELIDRVSDRLHQRCGFADMDLTIDCDDADRDAAMATDPSAVDQVLFNLVENACKYAAGSADKRVTVRAGRRDDGMVAIAVEDRGPGIAPSERKRMFRAFAKSADTAANTAPGVGLGLALSRRLARRLGGDLQLDPTYTGGCRFVLTLPAD